MQTEIESIQNLGEEKEVITNYAAMIYKTSNGQVGNTAHMI